MQPYRSLNWPKIALLAAAALAGGPLPAVAQIAKKLEPMLHTAAEKIGSRGALVLTMPDGEGAAEPRGILGVLHDESVRLLAAAEVRVLVSPQLTGLIERGELKGPVTGARARQIRERAVCDVLLTEVLGHQRTGRRVDLVLRDGRSDKVLWNGHVLLREEDLAAEANLPELNRKVVAFAAGHLGRQAGDGECWTLAAQACDAAGAYRNGVSLFGRRLGTLDTPLPGDIIQLEKARYAGRSGTWSFPHHTAIIETVRGGSVVGLLHQNFGQAGRTVTQTTLNLNERVEGTAAVFRPRPRVVKAMEPKGESERAELPAAVTVTLPRGVKLTLRRLEAGRFELGRTEFLGSAMSRVTLTKPFWIGTTEVTQAQWNAVMGTNPSETQGDPLPVTNVSWNDVQGFLAGLNRLPAAARVQFRLPTEAEWEYACRAGTNTRYSCGDDSLELVDYGWYEDNSAARVHAVAQLRPNRWGLHDMHGNVWELVQDFHSEQLVGDGQEQVDPQGPASGTSHTMRGGTFDSPAGFCSCGNRGYATSVTKSPKIGFRIIAVAR